MRSFVLLLSLNLATAAALMPNPKAEPGTVSLAGAVNAVSSRAGVRFARTIREKPSHVAGVITPVANTSFEILTGPRLKERMRVRFDRRTDFEGSDPGDLEPGRDADIMGARLTSGEFLAARVVIGGGGCPARMPDGAILYHARAGNEDGTKPLVPSPCGSGAGSL